MNKIAKKTDSGTFCKFEVPIVWTKKAIEYQVRESAEEIKVFATKPNSR